jgi:hypothetical protein
MATKNWGEDISALLAPLLTSLRSSALHVAATHGRRAARWRRRRFTQVS